MNAIAQATVLAVDDDSVSRIALAGVLQRIPGVRVVEAADGQAAWKLIHDGFRPTVCCTDVGMPRMDGLALMDRIRAHPTVNDMPVVLITGIAERDTVLAALARGAAGYIVKPFARVETVATLQRVVKAALLRHAEAPSATCARLDRDSAELARLLMALREQTAALVLACASAPPGSPGCQPPLDHLHKACVKLGLWRAAELIESMPAADPGGPATVQVLREVERLASDQLGRVRQLVAA